MMIFLVFMILLFAWITTPLWCVFISFHEGSYIIRRFALVNIQTWEVFNTGNYYWWMIIPSSASRFRTPEEAREAWEQAKINRKSEKNKKNTKFIYFIWNKPVDTKKDTE